MDEVSRTSAVYESDADAFVEKYRTESIAERFGDEFYANLNGEQILDVGCGPGVDTETFSNDGFEVVGFDLTRSFTETAKEKVPDTSFVRGDMRQLPFADETFDGIWSCASFLHIPREDAPGTLREFNRVLAEDGVVYLSVRHGEVSGYHTDGRYFEQYLPEEIRTLLVNEGFSPISIANDVEWVRGKQVGWLRIVARKE